MFVFMFLFMLLSPPDFFNGVDQDEADRRGVSWVRSQTGRYYCASMYVVYVYIVTIYRRMGPMLRLR